MSLPAHIDPVVFAKVREAFAEALGLDDDEVRLDSKLIEELGAESLDFLDIVFRLERAFDIKIPRGGIEASAREGAGNEYEVDGVLTPHGLSELRKALPEVPDDEFVENMRVTEIPELFRVETFYNMVIRLMEMQDGEAAAAAS